MKHTLGILLLALLVAACGAKVQRNDEPAASTASVPDASAPTPPSPCEGACLPRLVGRLEVPVRFQHLSVDPEHHRVYGEGARVDTTNPRAMTVAKLPADGPVQVNRHTGRYALTSEAGRMLLILNADDTLYDWTFLPGNAWAIGVDPASDTFYVTTRDPASLVVYDETKRTQRESIPLGIPYPFEPIFDASSGSLFVNFGESVGGYYHLRFDASFAFQAAEGNVLSPNVDRKVLYVVNSQANRLELWASGSLTPIPSQLETKAYWAAPDPLTNRLYVRTLHDISVFDQATEQRLGALPDPGIIAGVAFAPGDDTIYVASFNDDAQLSLLAFATQ